MVQRKRYRLVRLLKLESQFIAVNEKDKQISLKPDLATCFQTLKNILSQHPLSKRYKNDRLNYAIRDIKINDKETTILFAGGDSEIADPTLWNTQSDTLRPIKKKQQEKFAFTCHMAISKKSWNGGYLAVKEEATLFSIAKICELLCSFFKEYCCITLNDEETQFKAYPSVKIFELPSATLEAALAGETPLDIRLVEENDYKTALDEEIVREKTLKNIKLKLNKNISISSIIRIIRNRYTKNTKRFYIDYKSSNGYKGALSFIPEEDEKSDLETYLFAKKIFIPLDNELPQFSESISIELENKMYNYLFNEEKILSNSENQKC